MAISGAGRGTIVRDSGPGSTHGVPCAGATRHSTRRRSRSAAARFMPQTRLAFLTQQRSWPATFGCSGPYKITDDRSATDEPNHEATAPPLCGLPIDISVPRGLLGHHLCPRSSLKDAKMEACLSDAEAHSMLRLLHGEGMGHVASRRRGFCHIGAVGRARCCVIVAVAARHRQSNTAT